MLAENPDHDPRNPGGGDGRVSKAAARVAAFRLGILGLYLRLNKKLVKGSFSIVVFLLLPL